MSRVAYKRSIINSEIKQCQAAPAFFHRFALAPSIDEHTLLHKVDPTRGVPIFRMIDVCESCARDLKDHVIVKCSAFCSSAFCQNCSRLSNEMLDAVNGNNKVFWACNACKDLLKKGRFRCAMTSSNAANEMVIDALKTEIRDYVLGELKQKFVKTSELSRKTYPVRLSPSTLRFLLVQSETNVAVKMMVISPGR